MEESRPPGSRAAGIRAELTPTIFVYHTFKFVQSLGSAGGERNGGIKVLRGKINPVLMDK